MHVSSLFVYPVKSLRGCAVGAAPVDELGIAGDRRFLVVDEFGRFLTQRVLARMALITTGLANTALTLSADSFGRVSVPLHSPPGTAKLVSVSVWKSEGLHAEDCGEEPGAWLTRFLGQPCRLVRIGPEFHRPMLKATARPGDAIAFTDAFPFMVISEASLADLNRRLADIGETPVPMNRFRPTFVVAGSAPYAEDTWPRIRVGNLVLRAGGPCGRCVVTTTNQLTAERNKEPLRLLATYRRDATDPTNVNFGQNFIHETKSAEIRVGDEVVVL